MDRHFVRTVTMQLVYADLSGGNQRQETLAMLYQDKVLSPEAQLRIMTTMDVIDRVGLGMDAHIDKWSVKWSVDRIPRVVMSILRIGMYELLYLTTPPAVTINECVDLAWEFAHDDAVPYINGILSTCLREIKDESLTIVQLEALSEELTQQAAQKAKEEAEAAAELQAIKDEEVRAREELAQLDLADDLLGSYDYVRATKDASRAAEIEADDDE